MVSALAGRLGLVLLFVIGPSLPLLAQGVGAIGGTVMDQSNAVLPGVTVMLSSPGLIGGNQTAVTDGQVRISSRDSSPADTA